MDCLSVCSLLAHQYQYQRRQAVMVMFIYLAAGCGTDSGRACGNLTKLREFRIHFREFVNSKTAQCASPPKTRVPPNFLCGKEIVPPFFFRILCSSSNAKRAKQPTARRCPTDTHQPNQPTQTKHRYIHILLSTSDAGGHYIYHVIRLFIQIYYHW